VNLVTKTLFKKYRKPEDYLRVPVAALEKDIQSTGFFRNKAKAIRAICQDVLHEHGGQVPREMEKLVKLHGVGRKTANVVRAAVWGEPGIIVDTHVKRLATERLALTKEKDPVKIELDLQRAPQSEGRSSPERSSSRPPRCTARKPDPHCPLRELCPFRENRRVTFAPARAALASRLIRTAIPARPIRAARNSRPEPPEYSESPARPP
jgi:endonuclease-3